MKNLLHILVSFMLLSAVSLSAQTPEKLVAEIRAAAADACVTFSYVLDAKVDDVKIADEGTVVAQDDLWCLKGEAVQVYTAPDGTWILHLESKEAMVEPKWTYDDLQAFYKTIVSAASGNGVSVKIVSKTESEKRPVAYFTPDLDDEWIITDLR